MDKGRINKTRQKLHPKKYAFDDRQDPNNNIPYARHSILRRHIQQIGRSVWCIHGGGLKGHSKHNQTNESPNNQEEDQRDIKRNANLQSSGWLKVDEMVEVETASAQK